MMRPNKQPATARFFLDLEGNYTTIPDDEGIEASDVQNIIKEIGVAIGEIQDIQSIDLSEGWKIAIRNENGLVIMRIPIHR